jgi:hypothetical protein
MRRLSNRREATVVASSEDRLGPLLWTISTQKEVASQTFRYFNRHVHIFDKTYRRPRA